MPGARDQYRYPNGKPALLTYADIAGFFIVLAWVFLGYGHWLRTIAVLALFIAFAIVRSKIAEHYVLTGEAVKVYRHKELVKFIGRLPAGMRLARASFLVVAGVMLFFGFAPLSDSIAKYGIMGSILALFAVAILNISLEAHYVITGDAVVVDLSPEKKDKL